jgi:hypothetical protein
MLIRGAGPVKLTLNNCVHLGPGPLIDSVSSAGKALEMMELTLSQVTVYGAGTVAHSFPHAIDTVLPIGVTSQGCFLVPQSAEQPVLQVRYESQPGTLMPKVSWSGSATVTPADATLLEVWRGPDALPWRAVGLAAWKAYWGQRPTGVLGARIDFAAEPVLDLALVPRLRTDAGSSTDPGADSALIHAPPPVVLEQLPLMIKRLALE